MQVKSFHWPSHHGLWAIKPCLRMTRVKLAVFLYIVRFRLFLKKDSWKDLFIFGAFSIKQLFHSRLLDMRWRASLAIYHLISNKLERSNCLFGAMHFVAYLPSPIISPAVPGAIWSAYGVRIGYPSGQDGPILPALNFPLWSRAKRKKNTWGGHSGEVHNFWTTSAIE